jgi:leader peptidase (prepilin peptidase)/N-methyltransferase
MIFRFEPFLFLGALGLVWGVVADRIANRWPVHEPGVGRRSFDWRTIVVALVGGASLAAVGLRFEEPVQLVLFGAWAAILTLMLATDLDQRLLPDALTLPLIPAALIAGIAGWNPLVSDGLLWPVVAAAAFPIALYVLSIPFGPGAIGIGDLKLLVSVGLIAGAWRTFNALLIGALLSGVVILVLLVLRKITRRSYIPYGPFLVIGTLWAVLVVR